MTKFMCPRRSEAMSSGVGRVLLLKRNSRRRRPTIKEFQTLIGHEPQPKHYFDARGVKWLFMMTLEGSTWKMWPVPGEDWNGPDGPASISASSARSRLTARRSRAGGSAAWGKPVISGRSTSRSTTSASRVTALATRKETKSPARHVAASHDLIRVHGARENNLKDVSVEIPKRRLTVFTGVSGSGKSSLVFDTIAAESQRLINETYSAFVQGFMPALARPEVDVLEGLTTAIIVDQQRMGADISSTVGTATDASAMLRILFSRLGQPHIGSPTAFSFNVPSVRSSGEITIERGAGKTLTQAFSRTGGMCPRCEGRGTVSDLDLSQLFDDSKSLAEGAITIPGYKVDSWWTVGIFIESGFLDPNKPIRKYTRKELHDFLYKEPVKVKIKGVNLTYEGLIPKLQKSFLSKDPDVLQPHIRAFVDRAVTFTACPDCAGTRLSQAARSSRIRGINIADACAMEISDLAEWVRGLDERSVAPLLATAAYVGA